MLPIPSARSRVLLVVDEHTCAELLMAELDKNGHEVYWAEDTLEARWAWIPNYFDAVMVCAKDATGFVERIRKESPGQRIDAVSPNDLDIKKAPANVVSIQPGPRPKPTMIEMPPRPDPESA